MSERTTEPPSPLEPTLLEAFSERAARFREAGFAVEFQGDFEALARETLASLPEDRRARMDGATLAHERFFAAHPPLFSLGERAIPALVTAFEARMSAEQIPCQTTDRDREAPSPDALVLTLVGRANAALRDKGSPLRFHGLERLDASTPTLERRWILLDDAQAAALARVGLYQSVARALSAALATLPLAIAFWVAVAFAARERSPVVGAVAVALFVLWLLARVYLRKKYPSPRPS